VVDDGPVTVSTGPSGRPTPEELVVLVDESGHATGTAAKTEIHDEATPLHLAFSCYVFDAAGRLLVTTRARSKRTFPGVVTNTVCGHPGPGESLDTAVRRRADAELGMTLGAVRLVLPRFRYRAEMAGVVENELCPVLIATAEESAGTTAEVTPDHREVEAVEWVPWRDFVAEVSQGHRQVSPWCALQVAQLDRMGPDPAAWPAGDPSLLPPAARLA